MALMVLKWGTPVIFHFSLGLSWIFHEINHPALGYPPFMEDVMMDLHGDFTAKATENDEHWPFFIHEKYH